MSGTRNAGIVVSIAAMGCLMAGGAEAQKASQIGYVGDLPFDRGAFPHSTAGPTKPGRGPGLVKTPYEPRPWIPIDGSAPFRVLDTVVGPFVNLNNVPFSPFGFSQGSNFLAVANPQADIVRVFDVTDPNPVNWTLSNSFKTAWGPTSTAFWSHPGCQPELLVTCSNTDVLLWFSNAGRVQGMLGLAGEPSDLLVDYVRDVAWVSCMAEDVVIEIDLITKKWIKRYPIPSKHPAFLAFENGNTGNVLVTPMLSGNNTTVERGPDIFLPGPNGIIDLSTATKGLPDEDMFRLIPGGKVEPVVTRAGTVLFDHGRNPTTGDVWMLGTDAKNLQFQSEPEAKGIFSENRLSIVANLPGPGGAPVAPTTIINLDDSDRITPGVQYDTTKTVGQPNALAFDLAGNGYIAGMLTDNVTQLDNAGNFVQEWNVGSIPRALTFIRRGPNEFLAVFCWGTNTVEIYQPALGTGLIATLKLGQDSMPRPITDGRKVFYDASHSQFNNVSCNTCHIDGFSDMVAWDLSDIRKDAAGNHTIAVDKKGPLVTQTLRSILPQAPYHWRGERADLIDFNGAFEGLLGGTKLDVTPGGEFDDFRTFVFTLQERANPHESPRRKVFDALVPDTFPVSTSAVLGQDIFFDGKALPGFSCQDCHMMPSGTINDSFGDEPLAAEAQNSHFVVAPLLSFWRKLQPLVEVEHTPGDKETMPVLGVGLAATGLADNVEDFIFMAPFNMLPSAKFDVAAFLMQIDTGLPPKMHEGALIGYGANCDNGVPLSAGPASGGTTPPGAAPGTGGLFAQPKVAGNVPIQQAQVGPPGTTATAATELLENTEKIVEMTARSRIDRFDVIVQAELNGSPVEGVFDPDTSSFKLADGISTVNLTQEALLDAFAEQELVGMMFPMPLGQGRLYEAYDPLNGGPDYVVAGPGPVPPIDPGEDTSLSVGPDTSPDMDKGIAGNGRSGVREAEPELQPERFPVNATGGPVITDFEVLYTSARVTKLIFFTDVACRSDTEYTPHGGSPRMQSNPLMRNAHQVFLRRLDPSTTWDLRVTAIDGLGGTSELFMPSAFDTQDLLQPNHVRVSNLSAQAPLQNSGGVLHFVTDFAVEHLDGELAVNYTPVIDVLVYDSVNDAWRFDQTGIQVPGTDTLGQTSIQILVGGLNANDFVMVKMFDVQAPDDPTYVWSFPDTRAAQRLLEVKYSGTGP